VLDGQLDDALRATTISAVRASAPPAAPTRMSAAPPAQPSRSSGRHVHALERHLEDFSPLIVSSGSHAIPGLSVGTRSG
jgi:hypothetical protein